MFCSKKNYVLQIDLNKQIKQFIPIIPGKKEEIKMWIIICEFTAKLSKVKGKCEMLNEYKDARPQLRKNKLFVQTINQNLLPNNELNNNNHQ